MMKSKFAMISVSTLITLSTSTALMCLAACGDQADAHAVADKNTAASNTPLVATPVEKKSAQKSTEDVASTVTDKPLLAAQLELLDLAYKTASKLPLQPHVKNRARLQEDVVATCFKLDQPQRALGYIEKIDNWRRAAGYADYAFYCAQHGQTAGVQHYLDLAQKAAPIVEDDDSQDWQRDRIKATIAKTHLYLGHAEQATRYETSIVDSEMGIVDEVRAKMITPEAFDRQLGMVDPIVATNNFDQVCNVLTNFVQYYDVLYTDKDRRALAEAKIKSSWGKLPIGVRVDFLKKLTSATLAHQDSSKALELLAETRALIDTAQWISDDRIPLMSSIAVLMYRAGDKDRAREQLTAALALFDAEHDKIVNIYRARILRPVAEAYQSMGDKSAASTIYKRVVEEGVGNPNSRPRADDLTATCCSMAMNAVEPDAELKARLQKVHEALGSPW